MQSNPHRTPVNPTAVSFNSSASLSLPSLSYTASSSASSPTSSSRSSSSSTSTARRYKSPPPYSPFSSVFTLLKGRGLHAFIIISWMLLLAPVSPHPITGNDGENILDTNSTDNPLSDQPRENLAQDKDSTHWNLQPHQRYHHLTAGDQYLTVFENTVYGTFDPRPILGIFQFMSENKYLVIRHYSHQERFLCLNNNLKLYLSEKLNSECYLNELPSEKQHYTNYKFEKYQKYLGLDCDPLVGSEDEKSQRNFNFQYNNIDPEKFKVAKNATMLKTQISEKCTSLSKKSLQRLTTRWCWNLNRLSKEKEQKDKLRKYCKNNKREDPVCKRLKSMLAHVKRWKRKCLARRVITWISKKSKQSSEQPHRRLTTTTNLKAVTELSKRLLPLYSNVARRAQNIACKKRYRDDDGKNCGGRRRRGKSATVKPVKINPLLEKFKSELFNSSEASDTTTDSPGGGRPQQSSSQTHNTTHSLLSPEFRQEIEIMIQKYTNHISSNKPNNRPSSKPKRKSKNKQRRNKKHRHKKHRKSTRKGSGIKKTPIDLSSTDAWNSKPQQASTPG